MSIFSTLEQEFGTFGAYLVSLSAVSVILPLVLGVLARGLFFSEDTEDTGPAGSGSPIATPKDPEPAFEHTDWSGRFTCVSILAPPKTTDSHATSGNGKAG